jgi:hypothetical protein
MCPNHGTESVDHRLSKRGISIGRRPLGHVIDPGNLEGYEDHIYCWHVCLR